MAATAPTSSKPSLTDPTQSGLVVSKYDQVSGMLIAVLLLLGSLTLGMYLVWLSKLPSREPPPVEIRMLEDVGGGGSGSGMAGGERDLDEPSAEELPEVIERNPETTLEAIAMVVKNEEVALESVGGETSFGNGEGTGSGDGRGIGPGGPGTSDGIPAWERWEVRFSATNLNTYAAQLDFFGVELGVAGGGSPIVQYITQVSSAKPNVRNGDPKDEKRLRFMYRNGPLRDADRALAAKAGVDPSGKIVFQFYPPEMYKQLLTLENIQMGKRRIIEVKRTVFGVRPAAGAAGRFEFFVISQEYRG